MEGGVSAKECDAISEIVGAMNVAPVSTNFEVLLIRESIPCLQES